VKTGQFFILATPTEKDQQDFKQMP